MNLFYPQKSYLKINLLNKKIKPKKREKNEKKSRKNQEKKSLKMRKNKTRKYQFLKSIFKRKF